ncbi:MAG: hypothetical protein A2Z34_06125 [Planctomycetes bacterium RBG_16_59_8]|nr:MAG: hypothetical protein A2Z34_06125 [Planctomycetes bacterium RBG_16_59_8]
MTSYSRGDVILVEFAFSEETGSKKRPALIVSAENYHRQRREVIIAAITSNIRRVLFGDTMIVQWKESGLLFPSVVTGIVRTVKNDMIIRKLGTLPHQDFVGVQRRMRKSLGL